MSKLRRWATPLTIGSFLVMGVTGILMFFHLDTGLNKLAHEWAGWAMVVGVVAHLVVNWRAFMAYFKRPVASAFMAAGAVVLTLSFWPVDGVGNPMQSVAQAIAAADVATVVSLSGHDLDTGLDRLAAAGFDAQADTAIHDLTGGERAQQMRIISALFSE
ncbi:hypothetical protein AVO45_05150 [Ruegeria marisrubri]|uniref:Flavinylation-associated cytochrome domain-containing protein n=1 Tax=Ruegeria marisrubri TaxID=1685379 RepID=A0A0X3U4A3_9RHOB|nr:DUF4405 domain-containing protein [Ruegeria marisrubri]KUJ80440.1 hypothetical protein AVO45_05150 [Ruegeria marisrubri]